MALSEFLSLLAFALAAWHLAAQWRVPYLLRPLFVIAVSFGAGHLRVLLLGAMPGWIERPQLFLPLLVAYVLWDRQWVSKDAAYTGDWVSAAYVLPFVNDALEARHAPLLLALLLLTLTHMAGTLQWLLASRCNPHLERVVLRPTWLVAAGLSILTVLLVRSGVDGRFVAWLCSVLAYVAYRLMQ